MNTQEAQALYAESHRRAAAFCLTHAWKEAQRPDAKAWIEARGPAFYEELGERYMLENIGQQSDDPFVKAGLWVTYLIETYDSHLK
ncbi:hypothetical protein VPZ60_004314 [Salmonella enterica]|nr:hypothetical protein [Salmonella enterica]